MKKAKSIIHRKFIYDENEICLEIALANKLRWNLFILSIML